MPDPGGMGDRQLIERWRARAEEVRVNAEQTKDPSARQTLLRIAEQYDLLADSAERRLTGSQPAPKLSG